MYVLTISDCRDLMHQTTAYVNFDDKTGTWSRRHSKEGAVRSERKRRPERKLEACQERRTCHVVSQAESPAKELGA